MTVSQEQRIFEVQKLALEIAAAAYNLDWTGDPESSWRGIAAVARQIERRAAEQYHKLEATK